MPVRWTDGTERMMLIMAVQQNPSIKLDSDLAVQNWPADLGNPTKRSLGDRFSLLKKQIREGTVVSSLGAGTGITVKSPLPQTRTPQSIPRTPKAKKDNATKIKAEPDIEVEDSGDEVKAPTPISFQTRLLNSRSKPQITPTTKGHSRATNGFNVKAGNKRKRGKHDSEEESMTSHNSSSDEDNDNDDSNSSDEDNSSSNEVSPSRTTSSRRSLPSRRSKSMTPARYIISNGGDSESESDKTEDSNDESSHTEQEDDDEEENDTDQTTTHHVIKKHKSTQRQVTDDEAGDSDNDFDPTSHRVRERDGANRKKHRATWRERVAMVDGRGDDSDD